MSGVTAGLGCATTRSHLWLIRSAALTTRLSAGTARPKGGAPCNYPRMMLHLLVDTSTWLDLSKRRDGQKWIVAIRVLVHRHEIELLVPRVVVDEFERNRERVEASMTASVAQRFKLMKQDLGDYGGTDYEQAVQVVDDLAHEVPLIDAMTTRNFDEVLELLRGGRAVEASDEERRAEWSSAVSASSRPFTARYSTSIACSTKAGTTRRDGTSALLALGVNVSRLSTPNPVSWVPTRTLSWACSTASCPRCDGCWGRSGTSLTPN